MEQYFIHELINNPEAYKETWKLLNISGALHILPFIITLIIMCDGIGAYRKKWQKIAGFIAYFIIDLITCTLSYAFSHYLIKGDWDIDNTIEIFARGWYSYQDYAYIGGSLIISLLIGIAVAFLVRFRPKRLYGSRRVIGKVTLGITALSISGTLLIAILLLNEGFSGISHLMINEVCSNNYNVPINDDYDVCDYVEIYNNGAHACLTDGLYISDDQDNLKRLPVGEFLIPNYGRAVISFKDQPFGISKDGGEIVFLSDSYGNIIDSIEVPATKANQSYSRITNGANEWVITGCTPGENNELAIDVIDNPIFSADAGFYKESFELELSSPDNASIYYTLDGSEPSMDSYLYEGPIEVYNGSSEDNVYRSIVNVTRDWMEGNYIPDSTPVDKAFIVRARAILDEKHMSEVVTHTYFINLDKYKEHNVISLVGSPEKIFGENGIYITGPEYDEWYVNGQDPEQEIYANYEKRGMTYEVKSSMEYFGKDNNKFSQDVGLRIQGNSSDEHPLKPFGIFARKHYSGRRYIPKAVFGTDYTHSFSIRGGFSNTVVPNMVRNIDIPSLQTQTATIFLNGEFWYNGSLTEKYREDYFKEHYGVDKDNLIIIQDGVLIAGNDDETYISDDVNAYIDSLDFTKDSDYEDFCSRFDVQSYINMMCINAYITNEDHKDIIQNDILWKAREPRDNHYSDGRWRWVLFDLDDADIFKDIENNNEPIDRAVIDTTESLMKHRLFAKLIENDSFKKQFLDSFVYIADTCFTPERIQAAFDQFDYVLNDYKFQNPGFAYDGQNGSMEDFEDFYDRRRAYIFSYMEKRFGVKLN